VAEVSLNRLGRELRACCAQFPSAEKWLLAPSRRLAQQWAETVARAGQPVLNTHFESFRTLAVLRLAAPALAREGLTFLRGVAGEVMVARLFAGLQEKGQGYLSAQTPGPGLIRALAATLSDLRLAGLSAKQLPLRHFEVSAKGRELAALLAAYEEELRTSRQVDYAGVLRLAAARLRAEPQAIPEGVLVLLPEDVAAELSPLERAVWEAVPSERRVVLKTDRPGEPPEEPLTDAACLRWIGEPAAAPAAPGDGAAAIFRTVGEVNEVREVLSRCLAGGLPRDEVEILYTDSETYLPLLYEFASRLWAEEGQPLPITFLEGIPARASRPARALLGWLAWVREDFAQPALVHLLQDGLLDLPGREEAGFSFSRLAALLRGLPIGRGRDRYLGVLARELEAASRRLVSEYEAEGLEAPTDYARAQRERGAGLKLLHETVSSLLSHLPEAPGPRDLLAAAISLVETHARGGSELDEYSRARLLSEMRDLQACLEAGDVPGLEVGEWLAELAQSMRVRALGPRPGCLFAAPLAQGGQSGRRHTFLLGLDDGRFPGAGQQDPLLLDGERANLSRDLPTAASRLSRRVRQLAELFARLRGSVTLSYSCRDVREDRATFPSSAAWSAYRILSGEREGDQEAMARWLPDPPLSFAPASDTRCLDPGEWWLWRLCGEESVAEPEAALAACFPHPGRGFLARRARESDLFTEYDGYVPEAGAAADPVTNADVVLSASRLETLGRCPLDYFFKYVLEVQAPEEYTLDPNAWLSPAERGALLHTVFREFMAAVCQDGRLPEFARDEDSLKRLVEEEIEAWREERPPHHAEVCARECRELHRAARVFLREEERFCRTSRPVWFEAAIGLRRDRPSGPLDTPRPVALHLPDGAIVRACGILDRVDQLADSRAATYTIWDYKTGSSRRYRRGDPFQQGRYVQNALYLALAAARLGEVSPGATASAFGYFFPTTRDYGERLQWRAGELAGGLEVIASLCRLLATGCFPFTTDENDVRYSDYAAAYGDAVTAARQMERKLGNPKNEMLAPFGTLRNAGGGN